MNTRYILLTQALFRKNREGPPYLRNWCVLAAPLVGLHSAGSGVFCFFLTTPCRNIAQYMDNIGPKTHNKWTKTKIQSGSKNKKHFGAILGPKYVPRPWIRPSKLRFSGRIQDCGPYLGPQTSASVFLILVLWPEYCLWGVSYFCYLTIFISVHYNAIFSYTDKREVLQQEYSQPPILPSPHFRWVVDIQGFCFRTKQVALCHFIK